MSSDFRVGLALGGGAARGLAHVGVLRALERARINVQLIGGTSIGALIGGLYAASPGASEVEAVLRGFIRSSEFARMRFNFLTERPPAGSLFLSLSNLLKKGIVFGYSVAKPSFITAEQFAGHIGAILPDIDVAATRLPLVVVAADLASGREVDIVRGPLRTAVAGSCAIPGVLPPCPFPRPGGGPGGDLLLIDGGWINKVPVRPVRELGAAFTIACDVSLDLEDTRGYRNGLNILTRANAIAACRLKELQLAEADFVIRPRVETFHWADFSRLEDAIQVGEAAVEERRAELVEAIERRRLEGRLRTFGRARSREAP